MAQWLTLRAFASSLSPFHLAVPVANLSKAKEFYGSRLGLEEGRSAPTWQDYNFFGHQLVLHEVPNHQPHNATQKVDQDVVPVPHFGICLTEVDFHAFSERISQQGISFIIPPTKRFEGLHGEQWTMFFKDPSANCLEFKAMTNPSFLFEKEVKSDKKET